MKFLPRWFERRSAMRTGSRSRRPSHSSLALESLEERWTPAIETGSVDEFSSWITDTGNANTTLEIIDDLGTNTTYYRVNGGSERVLGTAGILQKVNVQMGAGNDKVIFTSRNGAGVSVGLYRTVDLGAGNDSLTINTCVAGAALVQYIVSDASGNDKYSFGGVVTNSGSMRVDLVDSSGNDSYTTATSAVGGDSIFSLYVDDVKGNDKYAFGGSAAAGGRLFNSIYERAGNDSYSVNATSTALDSNINYEFNDLLGNDKYSFLGSALDEALYRVSLTEGSGNDSYAANVTVGANGARFSFESTDSLGNDKYTFAGSAASAAATYYVSVLDVVGNDSYTLGGQTSGAGATFSYYVTDQRGNDKYTVNGASSSGGDFYAKLTDAEGSDKYTATGAASYSAFGLEVIDYDAASNDTLLFTPVSGAGATVFIAAELGGGNNKFTVKGARYTEGGFFTVDFDAFGGKDSVTIDDVAIIDSEATYEIDLRGGNDTVSLKLDGQPKTGAAISNSLDEVKNATYKVNLGDGNDTFTANVFSSWSLASLSEAGAGLVLDVHGDGGNDKLNFVVKSGSAPFAFTGPQSRFFLNLFGDDGDDVMTLNYGALSLNDSAASDSEAYFTVHSGAGKDTVSVTGTFLASLGTVDFNVDLGTEDDKLTTSIVTTKTTQLPEIVGNFYGGEGVNKLTVKKNSILVDNIHDFANYPAT